MNATSLTQGIAARTAKDISLCIATTREQRESVFELIYRSYRNASLCESDSAALRFTPYQLLPTTDVFFAQFREEAICTLSLVRDGELGLPMEDLYAAQIEKRRAAGLRLAEVSCLADRRNEPSRFFELFCDLTRLMVQFAVKQEVDQLLIAVHPRHAALYIRYMGFKKIGECRDYSAVNGNPAVPLCLDLTEIRANHPPSWEKYFGEQIPDIFLQPSPISAVDREYFLSLLPDTHNSTEQSPTESDEFNFFKNFEEELASDRNNDLHEAEAMLCV